MTDKLTIDDKIKACYTDNEFTVDGIMALCRLAREQDAEIERLKALVNLCIDDPQNWTQRAIELELNVGQDVEFYKDSVLAENKRQREWNLKLSQSNISLSQESAEQAKEIEKLRLAITEALARLEHGWNGTALDLLLKALGDGRS